MKKLTCSTFFIAALSLFGFTSLNGCSKSDATVITTPGVQNILDRDLIVSYAKDDNTDITSQFNGLTFHYTGPSTANSGPASAANTLLSVTGSWTMNASHNKITFAFPTGIFSTLAFMNKEWLIANTASNPLVLTATNGETDILYFSLK